MDAALSIAAPSPAGLPALASAPAEADIEGSFAAALTLCLAASGADAVPAGEPAAATPLAGSRLVVPGSAAEAAATDGSPTPVSSPASTDHAEAELPQPVAPEASPQVAVAVATTPEPIEPEHQAEERLLPETGRLGETLIAFPPLTDTPAPVRTARPPAAAPPSDEERGEENASALLAPTLPAPPSLPALPQLAGVASSPLPTAVPPSSRGLAPLAQHPAFHAEAPLAAPPPDMAMARRLGPADAPADPLASTVQTETAHERHFPAELAGVQQPARVPVADGAPAIALALPSPARQVSSVAVALAFAPNGSSGFSLSLDPVELGRVEIQVQREGDHHSVRVIAERPETLALLQRDRHELDRGLAEAGLRLDSSGIGFSLETSGGGAGQERGADRNGGPRGHAARPHAAEREPPPRLLRSLLDLNI